MSKLRTRWALPIPATAAELAEWFRIPLKRLEWLADCECRGHRIAAGPLQHYNYRWVAKRSGGYRLIEIPKSTLKSLQRTIVHEILDAVPAHAAAHGFRRKRSVISFARPHVAKAVVLRLDLRNFFVSVSAARVHGIFKTIGYSDSVTQLLTGLCTNCLPRAALDSYPGYSREFSRSKSLRIFDAPHLPQGAPTSPALANLAAYRLDCRLNALAGAADAVYTRYADDLLFSGNDELARCGKRFAVQVAAICMEEGFAPHWRKTRIMRASVRQHAAGLVLNQKLNLRRRDFDQLKAILHNCERHGPSSQNRAGVAEFRAHLSGRLAHLASINENRAAKLKSSFDRIDWRR